LRKKGVFMKSLRVFLLSIALLGANGLYSMKLTPSQQMSASISADRLKQITLRFKGGNMPLAAYQDAQRMIKQLEGFGRTEQAADFKKRIDDLTPVSVRQIADRKAIHTKEEPVVEGPKEEPVVEQPVQEPQEEPVVEQPKEEPVVEGPKEEPVVEQPVEQPKVAGQNTY
jgi:outer membrane biosynthesis protein TonB